MARTSRRDSVPESRLRSARLEARVSAEQKALIERAAALEGRSMTDFVLSSVQEAATRAIAQHDIIQLSLRDSRAFADALLHPREPSERMRKRVEVYKARMGDDET